MGAIRDGEHELNMKHVIAHICVRSRGQPDLACEPQSRATVCPRGSCSIRPARRRDAGLPALAAAERQDAPLSRNTRRPVAAAGNCSPRKAPRGRPPGRRATKGDPFLTVRPRGVARFNRANRSLPSPGSESPCRGRSCMPHEGVTDSERRLPRSPRSRSTVESRTPVPPEARLDRARRTQHDRCKARAQDAVARMHLPPLLASCERCSR